MNNLQCKQFLPERQQFDITCGSFLKFFFFSIFLSFCSVQENILSTLCGRKCATAPHSYFTVFTVRVVSPFELMDPIRVSEEQQTFILQDLLHQYLNPCMHIIFLKHKTNAKHQRERELGNGTDSMCFKQSKKGKITFDVGIFILKKFVFRRVRGFLYQL